MDDNERERLRQAAEAAVPSTPRPLVLWRYNHGGARMVREYDDERTPDLIADFYDPINREYYFAAHPGAVLALLAQLAAAEAENRALVAERGVLLNGAALVARYALPYFEKLDKRRPSHDTAELLATARDLIARRTPEANQFSVEWMDALRQRAAAAESALAVAWEQGRVAREALSELVDMVLDGDHDACATMEFIRDGDTVVICPGYADKVRAAGVLLAAESAAPAEGA